VDDRAAERAVLARGLGRGVDQRRGAFAVTDVAGVARDHFAVVELTVAVGVGADLDLDPAERTVVAGRFGHGSRERRSPRRTRISRLPGLAGLAVFSCTSRDHQEE
jgi:hypothetical protein